MIQEIDLRSSSVIDEEISCKEERLLSKFVIAESSSNNAALMVDLNPSPKGIFGQVVFVALESDFAIKVADSVTLMLFQFHEDLTLKKYTLEDSWFLNPSKELDLINWRMNKSDSN